MAQETAANMTAPEGAIWQAWLDAFIHPKFETYARWYRRMGARWRRLSLAVSLPMLLIAILVVIAHDAVYIGNSVQTLTLSRFVSYLGSPHGLFELIDMFAAALVAIFAMPATAAVFAHRSLGPYRIRFKRVFRPWMQVQPAICVLLLASALVNFVAGFAQSPSDVWWVVAFVLIAWPALRSWQLTYEALAAGSSRNVYLAGFVAAIPGLLWFFLSAMLGHV